MRSLIISVALLPGLLGPVLVAAEWTSQNVQDLTTEFQKYKQDWTIQETVDILKDSRNAGTLKTTIRADNGQRVWIEIIGGNSVLIDGKDVTGNLGSKTTYGDHSPIIEDIHESEITTGTQSPIQQSVTRIVSFSIHFYIHVALSIALMASVYCNIRLCRMLRKQGAAHKALQDIS